jgi:hypothetical protein
MLYQLSYASSERMSLAGRSSPSDIFQMSGTIFKVTITAPRVQPVFRQWHAHAFQEELPNACSQRPPTGAHLASSAYVEIFLNNILIAWRTRMNRGIVAGFSAEGLHHEAPGLKPPAKDSDELDREPAGRISPRQYGPHLLLRGWGFLRRRIPRSPLPAM